MEEFINPAVSLAVSGIPGRRRGGAALTPAVAESEDLGEWWLRTRPDEKVKGFLRFSPTDGGELTLLGQFGSMRDEAEITRGGDTTAHRVSAETIERSVVYPRIHGQVGSGSV